MAWIGLSSIVLAASLDAGPTGVTTYLGPSLLLFRWLLVRPKSATAGQGLYDKVFYEGPQPLASVGS